MPQSELLKRAVRFFEEAGIEWMLTGSLVSSLQGEPRATHDIDLVVELRAADVPRLLREFSDDRFYISEESVRDAIAQRSMFNVLDTDEGDKIDFWLLTDEPFDASRFARRKIVDFEGLRIPVSAPEDTILAKLRWCKMSGGSEKQFVDSLRVYEVQCGILDSKYLQRWAEELGLAELFTRLKDEAEPLE